MTSSPEVGDAGGTRLDFRSVLKSRIIRPGFLDPPDFDDMVQTSEHCEMKQQNKTVMPHHSVTVLASSLHVGSYGT